MRASIDFEDGVVEVLDAEAETRDPHLDGSRTSLCSVRVPGSHSKVISSASFHGISLVSRETRLSSCWVERNEGVPPPK